MDSIKYLLPENDLPTAWYNLQADLPTPLAPVLHPGTKAPISPDDLAPLFPPALIEQEVSTERWIEIPEAGKSADDYESPAPGLTILPKP